MHKYIYIYNEKNNCHLKKKENLIQTCSISYFIVMNQNRHFPYSSLNEFSYEQKGRCLRLMRKCAPLV